ncbi:MAG: hypothetical protein V4649_14970 [Bacteroidota bacterium]
MNVTDSRKDKVSAGIIILVHVAFFLLAYCYKRIYMGDSFEYIYEALNIKQQFFFYSGNPELPIEPEYMTQRQPVYPLFLLSVYLFAVNNWVVLVLQNVLSVFNILYTRNILLHIGYSRKYDWLLMLLLLAYPSQFINANTIAPDILLQTFTLLYFGNFVGLLQSRQGKYALWMSFALVAGMMTKPVLYPFVLVHILLLLVIGAKLKLGWHRQLVAAVLLPVCAVAAYNFWNYQRTGKAHFSSNQAFNAVYYYYPFIAAQHGQDSAVQFLTNERGRLAGIADYKTRYDAANQTGTRLLRENFMPYMLFHLKHSARMLVEPGKAEIDLFTGKLTYGRLYSKRQEGFFATLKSKGMSGMSEYFRNNRSMLVVILVILFNLIRLIGLLLFLLSRRIDVRIRLFVFVLIGYFAVAAGPIANTRYFLPVSLIAIGAAAMGYISRFNKSNIAG